MWRNASVNKNVFSGLTINNDYSEKFKGQDTEWGFALAYSSQFSLQCLASG